MPEQRKKSPCSIALLAHVDAGKTTLSEALLYTAGAIRTLGRVDHRDATLDTHSLERERGITIFSKQARLTAGDREFILVDTPGHVDFAPEAERTLPILDCAVLVISGTDGIQAHTVTLWNLLEKYRVPTFLFINKMDLAGADREKCLAQLQEQLSAGCVDFTEAFEKVAENAAMCDEALLEQYLESGRVTEGNLRGLIAGRKLFPCLFGSGLKLTGVAKLLETLGTYAPGKHYPAEFGAKVYKISRDDQGNRLTWLRITGGMLPVRWTLKYTGMEGKPLEEKVTQLRRYSGSRFTPADRAEAGDLVAVTGLTGTYAGQGLGMERSGRPPVLEPVMTYRVALPQGTDPAAVMPKLRLLEEEDPQLRLLWDRGQIFVQIMGKVQLQVLQSLVKQRFGIEITLDSGRIFYKETILDTVEGVGHFEPLRHYAEAHILLEPLPAGSGIQIGTKCPTDVLDVNYQSLILTHLGEKVHKGVLTGAPITDIRMTLLVGKAHLKHTEGGDFRQATYRAVRQGLMQAKSQLLEPWYAFTLTVPAEQIGRGITDIRAMGGEFDAPETEGAFSVLKGLLPASELQDYADTLAAYTQGRGRIQVSLQGYRPCHNAEAVIAEFSYDPESDLENTPDSVFCAHGAGFTVKWDQVKEHMHLDSGLKKEPQLITRNLHAEDKALDAILRREFGEVTTQLYKPAKNISAREEVIIRPPRKQCLIVDGYNVIFAWEELAQTAKSDLDAARRSLLDTLASYSAFKKLRIVAVFDGYRVKGSSGERETRGELQVVYTREGQTADAYMESLSAEIGRNYAVKVVTSDAMVQLSGFRSGVLRMSARELQQVIAEAKGEMAEFFAN